MYINYMIYNLQLHAKVHKCKNISYAIHWRFPTSKDFHLPLRTPAFFPLDTGDTRLGNPSWQVATSRVVFYVSSLLFCKEGMWVLCRRQNAKSQNMDVYLHLAEFKHLIQPQEIVGVNETPQKKTCQSIPSRELTYPTLGKGKIIDSKVP